MLTPAAIARLRRQLLDLPELLAYAHLAILPSSNTRSGYVTGATRTAPTPARLDVLSLLGPAATDTVRDPYGDQDGLIPAAGTITAWTRIHAEEHGQQPADTNLGTQLAYLAHLLPWAAAQPWADEYAAEIADLHRRCSPLALLRPRRRLMQLPCPRCRLQALVREDGHDIECATPGCGTILRPDEYDQRATAYADALNAA
ncbi:hypothetical protein [Kitasatospora cheerisanensis]|uniref:Uncharacterized protein n=1 Tax=Kitasatospora cheerisanensis KCTC 2395 TaxID=1348663 RepID=A0A066Z9B7_9ACTN|nr:hypothetical protein [Kitasatospora cheerisanensis]KDN86730.1 hypothetical protein KCH_15180 [Kitasatospora cheerisanensis KCTC 2395]